MTKYLIQTGATVLPGWQDYSEYDNLDDLRMDISYLKSRITDKTFRWSSFRVLKIETTEIFNSKEDV